MVVKYVYGDDFIAAVCMYKAIIVVAHSYTYCLTAGNTVERTLDSTRLIVSFFPLSIS